MATDKSLIERGKPVEDVAGTLRYLERFVDPIDEGSYGAYEDDARERLHARDEADWPILPTALALGCAIWTEDTDFFGTGVAVWTFNRIEIFLKAETTSLGSQES